MDPRNPAIDGLPAKHRKPLPSNVPVFDFVNDPERPSNGPAIGAPAVAASTAAWIIAIVLVFWVGKLAWGFLS